MVAQTATRERVLNYGTYSGTSYLNGVSSGSFSTSISGKQRTTSEGHSWPPKRGSSWDIGGPFKTQSVRYPRIDTPWVEMARSPQVSYAGNLIFGDFGPALYLEPSSDAWLIGQGTSLISRCQPTAAMSGFGVTLHELRQGLPDIIGKNLLKERLRPHLGLSKEYLNVEFGWKPLISDLRKTLGNVQRSHQIIEQLYRDSGRQVRRRYGLPSEVSTPVTESRVYYPWPVMSGYWYQGGQARRVTETGRDVWFSGAFTYYIPKDDSLLSRMRRYSTYASRLMGLRLDPGVIWDAAPWLWLSDWVANIGDVLANVSSYQFDGLVMRYGYVMEHKWETRTETTRCSYTGGYTANLQTIRKRECKRRLQATPFGFGLDEKAFTASQWAILAALGITQGHRTVHA